MVSRIYTTLYVTLVEASEIERKFSKMFTIKQAVNDKSTTPEFSVMRSQQTSFRISFSNVQVLCPFRSVLLLLVCCSQW